MTIFEIPLTPKPQAFTLPVAGVDHQFTVVWCPPLLAWLLSIADQDGNDILAGVPLVTGADLLEQHADLGLGVSLFCRGDASSGADKPPTLDDLGLTAHLYMGQP